MTTTNYRVSFYLTKEEYDKLKDCADSMTVLRGINTSVHELARSYVLKTLKEQ